MMWVNSNTIPREVVYAALRANLPSFAVGCITLLTGVSALLLVRLRSRHRLLLWVGVFSTLYAIRLLIANDLVRNAFNIPRFISAPVVLCITYAINIPFALFARELLGDGWEGSIVIWLWLSVVFAVIALPTTLFFSGAYWIDRINSILVVGGTILLLLHALAKRKVSHSNAASLLWPLLIFGIFVFLENKGIRPAGINIEPLGFIILLAGLASIAARRALATERKLIDVEQELATARRIQNSIVPHTPPEFPSVRFATRYQPMTAVAGDFYDFLNAGDDLVTVLVADVSGHGVPAALVASMLKVCFAAQQEQASNPAAILAGLNRMLRGSLGGQYVTAACAAIDSKARSITYAGAGHPPGLLFRKSLGSVVQLDENGLFIGPFPQATYSNLSVPFDSGDRLLLYTDGIVEASTIDNQEFGRERLEQFLLKSSGQEPGDFIDSLFRSIAAATQQDDLTAVLAHFH
jgi:sigma-B regulation protein RsbU (phosphoserine phosphatase)